MANRYPYRLQLIGQYGLPKLSGLGAKAGDFINIKMDIKSMVAGKGVNTIAYAGELLTEEQPTNPITSYLILLIPSPTEMPIPKQSTRWLLFKFKDKCIFAIESKPVLTISQILTDNPDLVSTDLENLEVLVEQYRCGGRRHHRNYKPQWRGS